MSRAPSASHRGRNDADDLLGARVEDLLDAVAADTYGPGGGSVAAIVVALSASLLAMTARLSLDDWDEAGGAIAQAKLLRQRAAPLAAADAQAFRDAIRALGGEHRSESGLRPLELGTALARAAEVPLQIAEAAADVAALAALVAERASADVQPDAVAAAALAEAGARAAAHLVEVNLGAREDDDRVAAARALVARAEASHREARAARAS
jgi:formiminotetrahydrofolate cyclodeaminase